jgi:predicted nucleic acid-binding protein
VLSTGETSTTMLVEPGILDANILAYAVNADAPQHAASRALLEAARNPSIALYVTSQILCEFYSLITNPRRVDVASSPTEALRIISAIMAFPGLHVLPTPARAVVGWMELLRRHPVTGGDVFDLQIVATMQANGVQRIYTFNTDDFEVFSELTVVTP